VPVKASAADGLGGLVEVLEPRQRVGPVAGQQVVVDVQQPGELGMLVRGRLEGAPGGLGGGAARGRLLGLR
jgi:hypothetical protein